MGGHLYALLAGLTTSIDYLAGLDERAEGTRRERLEISVTSLQDCRIPKDNILGSPEVNVEKGFAGVMQTFDNTRPDMENPSRCSTSMATST
ncbi:hypothetical protein [Nocardia carnea]|uniref:hypothetical protein n=1 Tax=Nocardia carnea TaxID=37328 RepID=UPI00245734C6|nr:hypothetical protein [Nocardia carnea]